MLRRSSPLARRATANTTSSGGVALQKLRPSAHALPSQRAPRRRLLASGTASPNAAFVSQHATAVKSGEVISWLKAKGVAHAENEQWVYVKECPLCPTPHNDQPDNQYKCSVSKTTGYYRCFRCGNQGGFLQLKQALSPNQSGTAVGGGGGGAAAGCGAAVRPAAAAQKVLARPSPARHREFMAKLLAPTGSGAVGVLGSRGIDRATAEHFGVGVGNFPFRGAQPPERECFTFPMWDAGGNLIRHKVRALYEKQFMQLSPAGARGGRRGSWCRACGSASWSWGPPHGP